MDWGNLKTLASQTDCDLMHKVDKLSHITPLSEKGEVSPKGGDIPLKLSRFVKILNVPCFPNGKTTILLKEANHVVRSIA